MKERIFRYVFVLLICGNAFAQQGRPVRYITGKTPAGFEQEINDFLRSDSAAFPPAGACLFTGSSSIRMWKNLKEDFPEITVINRGFGGSTMKALNYYLEYIVIPYKPATIVVYEGDNDLQEGMRPTDFISQCDTFIRRVHAVLPGTKIWFLPVKPSFARKNLLPVQDTTNDLLKKLTQKSRNTAFLDIRSMMYDKNGQLRKDYFLADSLHLKPECYRAWAEFMKKRMKIRRP
jgi:lysophospholipase L1-like esterase